MFDYGIFLNPKARPASVFRLPFHCGPIQARILEERAKRPKYESHLIYQPSAPNLLTP
ncbi:hypothetical protein [Trichocoleus sp. FACHB-591]|uniref:hypothetical protein n=1 Tax=Trichocoleus sp. FACHB-591 TaxID=2692872 RepID=UPI0016825CDB|nr:hypothetical protein [Trichocoleus sp. FACHB-591]